MHCHVDHANNSGFEIHRETCLQDAKTLLNVHTKLDLVNVAVRPLLFTKLSLFTKSSLIKEYNYEKRSWSFFIKSNLGCTFYLTLMNSLVYSNIDHWGIL